jgi:hypothetical protein
MNITQLINKDRKSRLETLGANTTNEVSDMVFFKSIMNNSKSGNFEKEREYLPNMKLNPYSIPNNMNFMMLQNSGKKPVERAGEVSTYQKNIVSHLQNKMAPVSMMGDKISKYWKFNVEALPKPVL